MIEYLTTLKKAHDHPEQKTRQFTIAEKVKILWKLADTLDRAEDLNKQLKLPFNSVTRFNIELKRGDLGIGHHELVEALAARLKLVYAKAHKAKK